MKNFDYKDMVKGWFVGGFNPTALSTESCEVAVKKYNAGDYESAHYHKIATEVTMVLSGKVKMCGKEWGEGDILVIEPGEITDFLAFIYTVNVVVKIRVALNDKYLVENE